MATLPTGIIGYIEIPITTAKPPLYRINVLNTLIHSVVQTYHPELTEPINVQYQDMARTNICFEVNDIDLFKDPIFNNTLCDVQLSQKSALPVLLHLP